MLLYYYHAPDPYSAATHFGGVTDWYQEPRITKSRGTYFSGSTVSLDYVPGLEEPEQAPPSPIYIPFVPEPVYLEFLPVDDEVFPVRRRHCLLLTPPTHQSPGYIPESDPEEDPEEDDEEDCLPYLLHPSPLSPYSSPLPQIPSPPLPIPSQPPNSPTYVEGSLGSRAAGIRQRDALPSPVHETEMPEICLPLRKRPCRTTPGPGYEVGESSAAGTARQVGPATARADLYGFADMLDAAPGRQTSRELGYGITDTWDDLVGAIQEIAPTTLEGVNQRVTELVTTVDQEDEIIYSQLDDARHDRALLRARVNMLYRDRPFHRRTALLMEEEARQSEITELQAADRRRQTVITDLLKADHRRQRQLVEALKIVKSLKTQMIELQRQQGPAKDPAEPELPEEASSSS
ncbi:hypothetical protein Tco_0804076 [Tanacetum coccineum]|uniref:Uncharacterized protein n=1 Tax=Tanacetum coccineum TaxID=301880 RepID=A0ABQ5A506_9ASTR